MNLWTEILRPGLLAAFWSLVFFIPTWALYRWARLAGRIRRFDRSIRLLILLMVGILFLDTGGVEALVGLEILLNEAFGLPIELLQDLARTVVVLVAALFGAALVDAVVFETYLRSAKERHVPKLLRDAVKLVIVAGGLGTALVRIWGVDATALGGGAAVVTLVLGLALQNVLGDLFSGVVLQFESPFKNGDWIRVGELEGEVVELNWRATRLHSRKNVAIVIPNSVVAKAELRNFAMFTPYAAVDRYVGTEYKEPPNRIKGAVMEAMLQCGQVLRQPPPQVWTDEYGDSAIIYRMRFWVREFRRIPEISDEVMTNVWYAFKRNDITIPWPIRNVYMRSEEGPTREERTEVLADLLRQVDLFTPLPRETLQGLAGKMEAKFFGRGEVLIEQGSEGESFFIVESGRVEVLVSPEEGGRPSRAAVLGPRDFFGEMSLLAGARRTATIRALEDTRVIVLDREAFAEVIEENPEVAAEMASIYYSRSDQLIRMHEESGVGEEEGPEEEAAEKALLRKIQRFFGLK
ncbi:MAG: mechanosensitive ion channel family protein [bacterium]